VCLAIALAERDKARNEAAALRAAQLAIERATHGKVEEEEGGEGKKPSSNSVSVRLNAASLGVLRLIEGQIAVESQRSDASHQVLIRNMEQINATEDAGNCHENS